jgi:hypothetical protein
MMGYAIMSDQPDPLNDVRRGLGLLWRAARTAARRWPTTDLEEVVTTSAREVGRAIENVAATIEREMFAKSGSGKPPSSTPPPPADEPKKAPDDTTPTANRPEKD